MNWILNITLIWLAIDLLAIGSIWYVPRVVPRLWPGLWRQVIVDTIGPEIRL
jgi:hypothetical protein